MQNNCSRSAERTTKQPQSVTPTYATEPTLKPLTDEDEWVHRRLKEAPPLPVKVSINGEKLCVRQLDPSLINIQRDNVPPSGGAA